MKRFVDLHFAEKILFLDRHQGTIRRQRRPQSEGFVVGDFVTHNPKIIASVFCLLVCCQFEIKISRYQEIKRSRNQEIKRSRDRTIPNGAEFVVTKDADAVEDARTTGADVKRPDQIKRGSDLGVEDDEIAMKASGKTGRISKTTDLIRRNRPRKMVSAHNL